MVFEYVTIAVTVFFGLALLFIFFYFQHTLHDIYSIFLSVSDEKLRAILSSSQRLIDNISFNTNRMIERVQAEEQAKKDQ